MYINKHTAFFGERKSREKHKTAIVDKTSKHLGDIVQLFQQGSQPYLRNNISSQWVKSVDKSS
jgi:hypothetical protein